MISAKASLPSGAPARRTNGEASGALPELFDHLARWLGRSAGVEAMAVVAPSESGPHIQYESGLAGATAWPVFPALCAQSPTVVGTCAVAPIRRSGSSIGALLAKTADRPSATLALDEIQSAADVVAALLQSASGGRPPAGAAHETQLLIETARALSSEPDLDSLFERFHALVTSVVPADGFYVALGAWAHGYMTIPYAVNEGQVERHLGPLPIRGSLCGHVFREGRPLVINRPEDFDAYPNVTVGEGSDVASALIVPMRVGSRTIGVISVQCVTPDSYTERHRDLIAAIGEQAAIAVESARHHTEAEMRSREIELLADVSRALSSRGSFVMLCRTVARQVRRVMDAHRFGVAFFADDGPFAQPEYALEGDEEKRYPRIEISGTIAERARKERRTVLIATPAELSRYRQRSGDEDPQPVQSIVTAPLIAGDRCYGVITAQSKRRDAYDEYHVRLMTAIAEQMALAVENARFTADAAFRAQVDPLTGLFHHGHLQGRLEEEVDRAREELTPLSIVMLDVENFRLVNATYGHDVGDEVLRTVAGALRRECRRSDVVGRMGGDEFMAILPGADIAGARMLAEKIGRRLAATAIEADGSRIPVKCAIGAAAFGENGASVLELIANAEASLHESRRCGTTDARLQRIGPRQLRLRGNFAPVAELLAALLARDGDTAAHIEHVNGLAAAISSEFDLAAEDTEALLVASVLHDVGKVAIPDDVLKKPGKLTPHEIGVIRRHPQIGADLLQHIPGFAGAADAVRCHHERFDGAGYPAGLAGAAIPTVARILSVIDAYSAMLIDRPYHKGISSAAALEELRENAGTQFDPVVVERFIALMTRLGPETGIV